MSRGKYASNSEARAAREEALKVARDEKQHASRLEAANAELRARVAQLEHEKAESFATANRAVMARASEAESKLRTALESLRESREMHKASLVMWLRHRALEGASNEAALAEYMKEVYKADPHTRKELIRSIRETAPEGARFVEAIQFFEDARP